MCIGCSVEIHGFFIFMIFQQLNLFLWKMCSNFLSGFLSLFHMFLSVVAWTLTSKHICFWSRCLWLFLVLLDSFGFCKWTPEVDGSLRILKWHVYVFVNWKFYASLVVDFWCLLTNLLFNFSTEVLEITHLVWLVKLFSIVDWQISLGYSNNFLEF